MEDTKKQEVLNQLKILVKREPSKDLSERLTVFVAEGGIGKSRAVEEALVELWRIEPERKSLVVKPFVDRKSFLPSETRINQLAGQTISIALDMENRQEVLSRVSEYPVLIITHARYLKLVGKPESDESKKVFGDRSILVIDEEPNIIETVTVSGSEIWRARNLFGRMVEEGNDSWVKEARIYQRGLERLNKRMGVIQNGKLECIYNPYYRIPDEKCLNRLNHTMDKYCKQNNLFSIGMDRLKAVACAVREFHQERAEGNSFLVATQNSATAIVRETGYILLENNILLDATAHLNDIYDYQEYIDIVDPGKVFDYSETTFHHYRLNTTRTAKKRIGLPRFWSESFKIIEKESELGDKILIVGSMADRKYLNKHMKPDTTSLADRTVKWIHFRELRGKNDWMDFDKCFLMHTPNTDFTQYPAILKCYLPFNPKLLGQLRISERPSREITALDLSKNGRGYYGFDDELIERHRRSSLMKHYYQAITRINRNHNKKADIYIFNLDIDMVHRVSEEMPGSSVVERTVEFDFGERKKYDNVRRFAGSYIETFLLKLRNLPEGIYKKKELAGLIGWKQRKTFNEKVISRALEVVREQGHSIEQNCNYPANCSHL